MFAKVETHIPQGNGTLFARSPRGAGILPHNGHLGLDESGVPSGSSPCSRNLSPDRVGDSVSWGPALVPAQDAGPRILILAMTLSSLMDLPILSYELTDTYNESHGFNGVSFSRIQQMGDPPPGHWID